MSHSQRRLSLKRAIGLSVALHFLLAPLIVTSALVAFDVTLTAHGEETTESTRVSYLEVEHRRPAVRPKHVVVAAARQVSSALRVVRADAPPAPSRPHARFVRRITPNVPRLHDANDPSGVPAVRPRALKGNSGAVVARDVAAEEQPAQPDAKSDVSPATAVATAAPSAAPVPQVVEAAAHGIEVPPGGWGQSFEKPLIADDAALADLRSRYHARSAVTVDVDEAGHATRIVLPSGLTDDVRAEIEKRLRELRYVPAECNGLRCDGTLQILI